MVKEHPKPLECRVAWSGKAWFSNAVPRVPKPVRRAPELLLVPRRKATVEPVHKQRKREKRAVLRELRFGQ